RPRRGRRSRTPPDSARAKCCRERPRGRRCQRRRARPEPRTDGALSSRVPCARSSPDPRSRPTPIWPVARRAAPVARCRGLRDGGMWSGRPNGRLVAEVAALTAGRALDVGCGEGADAIWLAQRGWTVTAIDISDVAICRALEASHRAGASVEWICGDVLRTSFPARSSDLVSMQYPALPKAAGEATVQRLLDTVHPGGLLLAVYHDLDDE